MHGVRAGGARGIEDALNREIAFDSWRGADVHGAIGREHVRRMSIGIRENGDALDGELPARANDPQCNFAAIGDQDATHHQTPQDGFRFPRKAFKPSWPSGETRLAAMAFVVTDVASSSARPQTAGMSAFAAATAWGPAPRISFT